MRPDTDAADVVVLNLWQAVQLAIAFRQLGEKGILGEELADRLGRAAGFRNLVVHGYQSLDLARLPAIARTGPPDLKEFLARLRDRL